MARYIGKREEEAAEELMKQVKDRGIRDEKGYHLSPVMGYRITERL